MNATLAVLFVAAMTADGRAEKTIVAHYSFEVPSGYRLKNASGGEGFDLYALTNGDGKKTLCTLYFGNAPRFPIRKTFSGSRTETRRAVHSS